MRNVQNLDEKAALGNFYKFIGNLFLRNYYPKKAKKYYLMSYKKGHKRALLPVYFCMLGIIASRIVNLFGKYINYAWKYQKSFIPAEFECENA